MHGNGLKLKRMEFYIIFICHLVKDTKDLLNLQQSIVSQSLHGNYVQLVKQELTRLLKESLAIIGLDDVETCKPAVTALHTKVHI